MPRHPRRSREKPKDKYEINEKIRASKVRVVTEDNEMLGVFNLPEALRLREKHGGLDLVSISPGVEPAVCKLIDYGKFLYQQEKKRKEVKKHQKNVQLKEIKMRPKTDVHDYDFKIKHAKEFLEKGNKVKITIRFKGREMSFARLGYDRINRIIEDTQDMAKVEVQPKMEGRNLHMVLGPRAVHKEVKAETKDKESVPKGAKEVKEMKE